MSFTDILLIMFGVILVENFIFSKFLGICPFLGVSEKPATALGMGMAVIFVITLASGATWAVYYLLLEPLGLNTCGPWLYLVIAALVQFIEMSCPCRRSTAMGITCRSSPQTARYSAQPCSISRRGTIL